MPKQNNQKTIVELEPATAAALCLEFHHTLPGLTKKDLAKATEQEVRTASTIIGCIAHSLAQENGHVTIEALIEEITGEKSPPYAQSRYKIVEKYAA
jgi:hypothetical protein